MKKIAIMQPTYLPWSGYFGLMHYVDIFVLLDSVQFERRSWQQRNKIKTDLGEKLLTIPVIKKGKRDQLINEVLIDKNNEFNNQHINLIKQHYSKAPFFKENFEKIFYSDLYNKKFLHEITITSILTIRDLLGIKTKIYKSSDLDIEGKKDNLLASICTSLNSNEYISPVGSKNYLDKSTIFAKKNITINYFKYNHPVYKQMYSNFISHLSVIDIIFNCGEKTLDLIEAGIMMNKKEY